MRLTQHEDVVTIQQSEEFELRDGITLKVQSLPPDYDDFLEAELPEPQPKRLGVEKDGKGRVVTGQDGRPVIRYADEDPDYLKAMRAHRKAQAMKMFVDGLEPGQIDFEATLDPADPKAFYRAVLAEMREFGFALGDLADIVKAVSRVSGISEDDIKVAEGDFY